ncbi:ABC transporter permease [Rhizohabitans arisaemae]|uniref:ABC transporter permease n=1 Tax=Rhizohabitans arisaemae TaxID=2720610 RepID=UPI0024B0D2CF|nr:ABC transporter permease [Rhizohabitans arisaemae]
MTTSTAEAPASALRPATRTSWVQRLTGRQRAAIVTAEVLIVLALWEVIVTVLALVSPVFLPPPSRIVQGFADLVTTGELWPHLGSSTTAYVIGYLLGAAAGVTLGLIIGGSSLIYKLSTPIIWSLYATPWIALRPLATVWFGFAAGPIIFLVFIASFYPVLLNTIAGVQTVNRSVINAARVFGASRVEVFRKIALPSTFPYVLTGLRHAVVIGMIGLIVGELTGASTGLGALITLKTSTFKTGQAFAVIILTIIWTVGLSQLMNHIAKSRSPWLGRKEI